MGQEWAKNGQKWSKSNSTLDLFFPNCALKRNFSEFFRAASRLKLCVKTGMR